MNVHKYIHMQERKGKRRSAFHAITRTPSFSLGRGRTPQGQATGFSTGLSLWLRKSESGGAATLTNMRLDSQMADVIIRFGDCMKNLPTSSPRPPLDGQTPASGRCVSHIFLPDTGMAHLTANREMRCAEGAWRSRSASYCLALTGTKAAASPGTMRGVAPLPHFHGAPGDDDFVSCFA